jgi:hypothetical protein
MKKLRMFWTMNEKERERTGRAETLSGNCKRSLGVSNQHDEIWGNEARTRRTENHVIWQKPPGASTTCRTFAVNVNNRAAQ